MSRTRLAVTLGDPRGIGPEIVAAALSAARVRARADARIGECGGDDLRADPAGVAEGDGETRGAHVVVTSLSTRYSVFASARLTFLPMSARSSISSERWA